MNGNKGIPDTIYLQVYGDSGENGSEDEIRSSDVTWSEKRIYPTDVEYRKAKKPWISVEERYPSFDKDNHKPYLVRVRTGSLEQRIYYAISPLVARNRFGIEMDWTRVTHWMPIPSFDEILEANKDVLKRLKEKEY